MITKKISWYNSGPINLDQFLRLPLPTQLAIRQRAKNGTTISGGNFVESMEEEENIIVEGKI